MNAEEIRNYCIVKPDVEESFPFDKSTLVFKVKGKMFLLVGLEYVPLQFNAKCDPDRALELREQYNSIIPGYHMNKKHWNSIIVDGSLDNRMLKKMIDHSYDLVSSSVKIKKKK